MSNAPITVSGRALPEAVTKNIIKGPIVKPVLESSLISNDILGGSLGFNQSIYKVKLVANGRTFNMLLPPSIESKHPGRSNPLQLPGLQIESTSNISKLKIPGFFPIYQHLGVESLYISMSGMFTGYDGEDQISAAGDWEGWAKPEVKGGQDAYTAACDLFDFAVKNKALTTVTISTSDGSFEPKKSGSTNFRDERSNIRFKGYIKELKQIYIRQDRVYYMLKFEIIDLGNSKKECTSAKKLIDSKLLADTAARGLNNLNTSPLTPEDISYLIPNDLQISKDLVEKINKGQQLTLKDLELLNSLYIRSKLAVYADSKGQQMDEIYKNIINLSLNPITKSTVINNKQRTQYILDEYTTYISIICGKLNISCEDKFRLINTNQKVIDSVKEESIVLSTSITIPPSNIEEVLPTPQPIPKVQPPIEELDQRQIIINTNAYNRDFTNKYITNQRISVRQDQANKDFKIFPEFKSSIFVSYKGNVNRGDKVYPVLEIRNSDTGLDIGTYVATPFNSTSVRLERR